MKKFLLAAVILTVLSIPTFASADIGVRPIAPEKGISTNDIGVRP